MASEKARLAKDKGNAAFKGADYAVAVGHYTDAILADSSDHTFFLNRAAAYLKLNKSEDAERDCTTALKLSPDNVKALFRRAQARKVLENLDDAQADLDKALALEPTNASVKNEIVELAKLSEQQKLKQRSKHTVVDTPKVTAPKRRRVPIEIVEPAAFHEAQIVTPIETSNTDLLQPVSSRILKQENKPTTSQAPPLKPQTFVDAKQARKESKPARVSGGIFRPAGNHTIVTRTPNDTGFPTPKSTPRPMSSDASAESLSNSPITLFQFTKSWDTLQSDMDRWNLIRMISPSSIPALFKVSLEPGLLRSILGSFQVVLEHDSAPSTKDLVRDYLSAFTKVPRFGTVMLFIDKKERKILELLNEKVNSTS